MIRLSDIGEFCLIKRFSEQFLKDIPGQHTGIGDDCAVVPLNEKEVLLVTTDMLIEDSHFIKNRILPFDLGFKSLMVNLSDIAAMGGTPGSAYLSIGLPAATEVEWIDEFFKGIKSVCDEYGVHLLGGDTTKSPDRVVVNFTVIGKAFSSGIKKRSGAKPGDIICVNDFVGDSGGGLQVLLNNLPEDNDTNYLVRRHHRPRAHIQEGRWLAGREEVNAMMDISDGIESDIQRIMESSAVGAVIDIDRVPVSAELLRTAQKYHWNAPVLAVSGGEDYCLLFTVREKELDRIAGDYEKEFGKPLYGIGTITGRDGKLVFRKKGRAVGLTKHGFDHFRQ